MEAVLVMLNNYFHDLATALLAASGALAFLLLRSVDQHPSPEVVRWVLDLYPRMTKVARVALVWILLGGIPRLIYFERLELWDAASKAIVPALAVKHVVMFGLVAAGAVLWRRLGRRAGALREGLEA
jgi:hypothetical protein